MTRQPETQQYIAVHRKQHGATLILSLIILVILTILGTSSMNGSHMELKMISNTMDGNRSFQDAEGARLGAEERVRDIAADMQDGDAFPDGPGLYDVNGGDDPPAPGVLGIAFWEDSDNYHEDGYVIEYLGEESLTLDEDKEEAGPPTTDMNVFRITVKGEGLNGAETALQAVYMQPADD
jgi:type IV pilus assembly protein PilX